MAHKGTETFALRPHVEEAAGIGDLIPDQLRQNAKSFIDILKEYYAYLNEHGQVSSISVLTGGEGATLKWTDINQSNENIGLKLTNFTPTDYNQLFVRSQENKNLYIGQADSNFIITKTLATEPTGIITKSWIMADSTGLSAGDYGKVDFYDKNYNNDITDIKRIGSRTDSINEIDFIGNPSGTLTPNSDSPTSFAEGAIVPVSVTQALVPTETVFTTFTNMEVTGGYGKGLTVDIKVEGGVVTEISPNKPGFGYQLGDVLRLKDRTLSFLSFEVSNLLSSPSNVVRRVLGEHDIDKTSQEYLDRIQKEIASSIPNAKLLDRKSLYKKIVEYYNTRGSEDSITSFFKIFFNEAVSVTYPKDQLLIPSDNIYAGSSVVSPTKEKYFYKKSFDNFRRIHILRNETYKETVKAGTYFLDFEIGDDFVLSNPTQTTSARISQASVPLFSATGPLGNSINEYHIENLVDAGFLLQLRTNGDLVFRGTFGHRPNSIEKVFTSYWDTLVAENNLNKKRIRIAVTVDTQESSDNYNSPTDPRGTNYDSPTYHIGSSKISISTVNVAANNVFDMTSTFGDENTDTADVNLYPTSIGAAIINGSVGTGGGQGDDFRQNPDGEIYTYGFGFVNRICTDTELQAYASRGQIPTSGKLLDIDMDNGGNSTFTNKGDTVPVAVQVRGYKNKDGNSNSNYPFSETNFGLSSTGSEYPKFVVWLNKKGFISDINRLHDGLKFQQFSYILRTALATDEWKTEYSKLVHPAGLKFFAAIYLELDLSNKGVNDKGLRTITRPYKQEAPVYDLAEKKYQQDLASASYYEKHSPHYQFGDAGFRDVLLELVVYRYLSAFYKLEQANYNSVFDKYYNDSKGLRIRQEDSPSLFGNGVESRFDTSNYQDGHLEFSGDGTALITGGRIDENSKFEIKYSLTEDNQVGKYIAGTQFKIRSNCIRYYGSL